MMYMLTYYGRNIVPHYYLLRAWEMYFARRSTDSKDNRMNTSFCRVCEHRHPDSHAAVTDVMLECPVPGSFKLQLNIVRNTSIVNK